MRFIGKPHVLGLSIIAIALWSLAGLAPHPAVASAQGGPAEAAVMDVVQRFNMSTVEATAQRDPTIIQEFATEDFYGEMALEMRADWSSGVAALRLVDLEWGTIRVTGDTASAYTVETWGVQLVDGSGGELPPEINLYQLVREDGVWKVDSNDHPGSMFE